MFIRRLLLIFSPVFFLIFATFAMADLPPLGDEVIEEKARKRLYPGGRDEEDLKVLGRVPEPLVKVHARSVQDEVIKSMTAQKEDESEESE